MILPLGGIRVSRRFGWGSLSALVGQDAEADSSVAGLYGSPLIRRLSLQGSVNLAQGFNLLLDCTVMRAQTAFESKGMLAQAPVISTGAGLEYAMGDNFTGSVRFSHRRIWESGGLSHGYTGPAGSLSIQYAFN
jgi:hypothetical protein